MNKIFAAIIVAVVSLVVSPIQAHSSPLGCIVGGGAGGLLGSLIGSGSGQLVAVGAGAVLGCASGNSITNNQYGNNNQHGGHGHQHSSVTYQTYKERYGCYTVTHSGYVPCNQAGHHFIRTSTPGYTYSKSVYYDQQPGNYGIYPTRRTVVHHQPQQVIVQAPPVVINSAPNYGALGCSLTSGQPYLREYTQPITVGGREVQGYGNACYTQNGDWRIVDGPRAP